MVLMAVFVNARNPCYKYSLGYDKVSHSGTGNVCFLRRSCTSETSMRLSDYVLQTFLVNIFSLAIAIFSIFMMANGNFKMADKHETW